MDLLESGMYGFVAVLGKGIGLGGEKGLLNR